MEEDIIVALKNGNVPPRDVKSLCIGREEEIKEIERLLDKVDKDGTSIVKFVNGEFGAGKSFFLKVIEELAFENNFVVSWITIGDEIPFHKIDVVYKNIVRELSCKTGDTLEHIIKRWLRGLKSMVSDEVPDSFTKQLSLFEEYLRDDLAPTREQCSSFAVAIENYSKLMDEEKYELANYAQAWLRGDSNIPYTHKRQFGVKGDITKENALNFLEALSMFVKSVGYSGLVVLVDEMEYIMTIPRKNSRNTAYNYIRDIYDNCSFGNFKNTFFIFAGTPELFDDKRKGIPSYKALDDRIKNKLDSDLKDMRQPIFDLEGFEKEDLIEISKKIIGIHSNAFEWDDVSIMNGAIEPIVDKHIKKAGLTGGIVIPRDYIGYFVSVLDTVQQNQDSFKTTDDVLDILEDQTVNNEQDVFDDW